MKMDSLITRYIVTIPLVILFRILVSALNSVWLSNEDYDTVLNAFADKLVDGRYATEEGISEVFVHLGLRRNEPSYGECGFRCDGGCQTCIRLGGGGTGLTLNASGYYD